MQPSHQLQPYEPPIDYSRGYTLDQPNTSFTQASASLPIVSPPLNMSDGLVSFDHLAENDDRLQRTYTDSAEIDSDVDALRNSINSFIESLGLDPDALASSHGQDAQSHEQASINPHDTVMSSGIDETQRDQSGQDFDFDAFLTDFTREGDGNTDYTHFADKLDPSARSDPINDPSTEQLTAFLDEVTSPSDGTVSPINFRHDSPDLQPRRGGKRKSDVAGISTEDQSTEKRATNPAIKLKRKKINISST
jgi:heat shock transcription factor